MAQIIAAFFTGLLFALGLGVSGMTRPSKVLGFLDLAGSWDPSLLFVMVGGIAVFTLAYRFVLRRGRPILAEMLQIPTRSEIDRRLVVGAVIFGVGWGLAGFCPGPGVVSLGGGVPQAASFVVAMIAGQLAFVIFDRRCTACATKTFAAKPQEETRAN